MNEVMFVHLTLLMWKEEDWDVRVFVGAFGPDGFPSLSVSCRQRKTFSVWIYAERS